MTWWWVSLPYATFGVASYDGRIVQAAPIARWSIGKPEDDVLGYFRRRGATIKELT